MSKARILIVEDDNDINNMLNELLTGYGFLTGRAYSGTEALLCISQESYDLVLLDLMLPGLDGQGVLNKIRETMKIPVIAVSALDDTETKVSLLKSGADDYITKPFDTEEMIARIEALLRRHSTTMEGTRYLKFKDVTIDRHTLEVTVGDTPIILTKREYLILELLMSNPKKVYTKNNIFESVWNEQFLGEDNAVNVHISNIRAKLAKVNPEEKYIQTVWGIGFKMNM